MDPDPEVPQGADVKFTSGQIEFRNIRFAYPLSPDKMVRQLPSCLLNQHGSVSLYFTFFSL